MANKIQFFVEQGSEAELKNLVSDLCPSSPASLNLGWRVNDPPASHRANQRRTLVIASGYADLRRLTA